MEEQRSLNDAAFRAAWTTHEAELRKRAREIVHEPIRLGALLAFAALARWRLRGDKLTWRRIFALGLLVSGMAFTIAQIGEQAARFLDVNATITFSLEVIAALISGFWIEYFVSFDPKKALSGKDA